MADANTLEYLIPTGAQDIAVREILIPIFGEAISCKVPGAPCGTMGDQLTEAAKNSGELLANLFQVFNASTLIFLTILLIFVGLFGFTKTALEGEFLGRSWNTAFTGMRLVTAVCYLLPMPNSYSVVQNFAMYVTLWGSGVGNQVNVAIADTYLKRLQRSMMQREPNAASIDTELRDILMMRTCVALLNQTYPKTATSIFYSDLRFGADRRVNGTTEYGFYENGNLNQYQSAPCGTITIRPYKSNLIGRDKDAISTTPTSGVWNSAFNADPLTVSARETMVKLTDKLVTMVRDGKTSTLITQLDPSTGLLMGTLSESLAQMYIDAQPKMNDDGNGIKEGPKTSNPYGTVITPDQARAAISVYASLYSYAQKNLDGVIVDAKKIMTTESTSDSPDSILVQAKKMLTQGGWMATASTYRTMLDMVSIDFNKTTDKPFELMPPNQKELLQNSESGANSMGQIMSNVDLMISSIFDSTEARETIASSVTVSEDARAIEPPKVNKSTFTKLASSDGSTNAIVDLLYGSSFINAQRNAVIKGMAVSPDADPLYQLKNIGDTVTATAEVINTVEIGTRVAMAALDVTGSAVTGNLIGKALGANDVKNSLIRGGQYILEGVFSTMRAATLGLLGLGYMFSTWLPALPFVSFLMAQMGWLFGAIMTLFALNIWAVMHATPARSDSFIGSEAQGYLLLVSLFFRPAITTCALAFSYVIAPPVVKLVNITLIPLMYATNVSSNTFSVIFATIFCLILYFVVIKGVLVMVYSIPQSFPDEVMRIISAGIGDLGQSSGMSEIRTGGVGAAAAITTLGGIDRAGSEHIKGTMNSRSEEAKKARNQAAAQSQAAGDDYEHPDNMGGGTGNRSNLQQPPSQ